jgi:hypothetical protein
MKDASAPIRVEGRLWGGCGFAIEREPRWLQRVAALDAQFAEYGFSEVLYLGAG